MNWLSSPRIQVGRRNLAEHAHARAGKPPDVIQKKHVLRGAVGHAQLAERRLHVAHVVAQLGERAAVHAALPERAFHNGKQTFAIRHERGLRGIAVRAGCHVRFVSQNRVPHGKLGRLIRRAVAVGDHMQPEDVFMTR